MKTKTVRVRQIQVCTGGFGRPNVTLERVVEVDESEVGPRDVVTTDPLCDWTETNLIVDAQAVPGGQA